MSIARAIHFPTPTLSIEYALQEVVELFLSGNSVTGNEKFRALPPDVREALHAEFYALSTDPDKSKDPLYGQRIEKEGISPSYKAALITEYVRKTLFKEDLDRAKAELAALNEITKTIDYETHSRGSRTPETFGLTYAELYPYDATRISLSDGAFISANRVLEKYIVTQSPIEDSSNHTAEAFWQMIDETTSHTIVMLNGEPATFYFPYFPHTLSETCTFGSRSVTLIGEEHHVLRKFSHKVRSVSDRTLLLKTATGKRRIIHHLKANHWWDFTAGDHITVEKLIALVRGYQKKEGEEAPTVIHCRGGVGRAGQFTLSLDLEEAARAGRDYSLPETLAKLRNPATGRCPTMVQREEQYLAVTRFLKNIRHYQL